MTEPPPTKRFAALDAWRGICALMVALLHYSLQAWPVPCGFCASPLIVSAWLFVDFFFVLSGFVIGHAYRDRIDSWPRFTAFVIKRFGRLWPLHVTTLFMIVALRLVVSPMIQQQSGGAAPAETSGSVAALGLDVLMVRALGFGTIDPAYHLAWNYPSWSIGVEFWACVLFGLLCLAVRGRMLRHAVECMLLALCAVLVYQLRGHMDATDDFGFFRCVYGFLAGRLLYELYRRRAALSLPAATIFELVTIAAVGAFVSQAGTSASTLAAPLIFAAAIWVFAHEQGAVSRALRTGWPQVLGTLSYSIYMLHVPVYELLLRLVAPVMRFVLRHSGYESLLEPGAMTDSVMLQGLQLAVVMALVIAASALTYAYVEQPGRRYFNAVARRRGESL